MEFSSQEFADLTGISKKSVQNYRVRGMPSIKKNKYYSYTFEAIQWLYDNGIKEVTKSSDSKELTPKYRKDLADAKLKEHTLAIREEKYILKSKVEEDLFILARELRDSFNNISKISPNLVGKNVHEIKTIIDANTYRILNSFADSATNYTQETI